METDAETQSKTLTLTQVSCRIERRRIVGAREEKKNPENPWEDCHFLKGNRKEVNGAESGGMWVVRLEGKEERKLQSGCNV